MPRPELSLVIPIHDEEDTLPQLDVRLQQLLAVLPTDTEVLFVDDGSADGSIDVLRRLAAREGRYRVLGLSRRFGGQHAIAAGMDKSRGRAVVVMNAEPPDPPDVVLEMVAKWREGYDVVYGRRRPRIGESTFNVLATKLFERVFAAIIPIEVPRNTGDFRLVSRRVVRTMRGLSETHRFVRGLVAWVGFKQTIVEYDASGEAPGKRTPPLKRIAFALDVITSFSIKPLRVASSIAFFVGLASFLCAIVALLTHDASTTTPGWTTLVVLVSVLFGVTFLVLGVFGEYVGRIYEQVKRRPLYIVSERINFRPRKVQSLSTSDLSEVAARPAAPLAPPGLPPLPPPALVAASAAPEASRPPPVTVQPSFVAPVVAEPVVSAAAPTRPPVTPSAPPPKVAPNLPAAPSVPPPTMTPSTPPVKAASIPPPSVTTSPFTKPPSIAPPAMTPSTPPVKAGSIAPPPIIRSAPPAKTPSIAPPAITPSSPPKSPSMAPPAMTPSTPAVKAASVPPPKPMTTGPTKSASIAPKDTTPKDAKSVQASAPPKSTTTSTNDPKKLFGTGTTSSKDQASSGTKPLGKGAPSIPPKAPDARSKDERAAGTKDVAPKAVDKPTKRGAD